MNIYEHLIDVPDAQVNELAVFHHSVYIDSIHVGLASTVNTGHCACIEGQGTLHTRSIRALAKMLLSENTLAASIGLAAANAHWNNPAVIDRAVSINAFALAEQIGAGKDIAVIGSFPNVHKMRTSGKFKKIFVFELNPDHSEYGPEDYETYLPQCSVVLITGTTVINHTLEQVLKHSKNSLNIMVGPSTPLCPVMFDYGIDVLCGAVVIDKKAARTSFAEACSYRFSSGLQYIALKKE